MSYPSSRRATYTILVLSMIYLFSFMDRQILVLLVEPIKRDLQLDDVQMSLLTGAAFAILYSVMGVPMGWAADRYSRKWIIGIGITVWSSLTIACGLASSFIQMFVARMGVGIGEAALTPTAHGMIPDLVPPHRRARAMALFSMSACIGGGAALLLGGYVVHLAQSLGTVGIPGVGQVRSWQLVLVFVGALTLLMLIPLRSITDPRPATFRPATSVAVTSNSLRQTLIYMWAHRGAFAPVMIGVTLLNLFEYGAAAWVPSHLIRTFHIEPSRVGYLMGAVSIVFGVGGVLMAGAIADRLRARNRPNANLTVMLCSLPISWSGLAIFTQSDSIGWAIIGYAIMLAGIVGFGPLSPAALQSITRSGMRSQVAALWLLVANLFGIGFGPTAVAMLTEYYFHDPAQVGMALLYMGTAIFILAAAIIGGFSGAHARLVVSMAETAQAAEGLDGLGAARPDPSSP